jgi:hypothetical protein
VEMLVRNALAVGALMLLVLRVGQQQ